MPAYVGSPDLLDEAMSTQALEQAGDLRCGAVRKVPSQVGGAQAGDGRFRACEDEEQLEIAVRHQVEAAQRALLVAGGPSDAVDVLPRGLGIVDGGEGG